VSLARNLYHRLPPPLHKPAAAVISRARDLHRRRSDRKPAELTAAEIRDARIRPWRTAAAASGSEETSRCNICGWHGGQFATGYHSEGALCPHCGSIARDRFLYWCWTQRTPYRSESRVLETSPRLDDRYRATMVERVHYTCSDYDESAHRGAIKLDLQDAALPDDSIDVVLTPHVLEHVPDTTRALAELYRFLAPGGDVFVQIPMPQAVTAPPTKLEYHGDNTLVYWRFGWDLRQQIEAAGFVVECLVTADLKSRIEQGRFDSGYGGDDCDEVDLLSHATASDLTVVASSQESRRYGFLPDFMFMTWHAHKPE
jgi:SAM-dependent methyltransferase